MEPELFPTLWIPALTVQSRVLTPQRPSSWEQNCKVPDSQSRALPTQHRNLKQAVPETYSALCLHPGKTEVEVSHRSVCASNLQLKVRLSPLLPQFQSSKFNCMESRKGLLLQHFQNNNKLNTTINQERHTQLGWDFWKEQ